jgi:hypothetical protein
MALILPYSDSRFWSPLWTQTPLQFGLASSIFFLSLPGQLTRSSSECLIRALSDRINVYLILYVHTRLNYFTRFFSRSDFYLSDRTCPPYLTSLPDPFPIGLLTTRSYPATLPGRVTLWCTFRQAVLHRVIFYGVTSGLTVVISDNSLGL